MGKYKTNEYFMGKVTLNEYLYLITLIYVLWITYVIPQRLLLVTK